MIIACPACSTRYVVPDSAIGIDGRTVRCAKCKHSWYQDGPETPGTAAPAAPPAQQPAQTRAPAAPPVPQPREGATGAPPSAPPVAPSTAPAAQAPAPRPAATTAAPVAAEPVSAPPPRVSFDDGFAPRLVRDKDAAPAPRDFDETDPPFGDVQDDLPPPPVVDPEDEISRFDHAPPFRPRRNIPRLLTWAAAGFAALALGTVALISYTGAPSWLPIARPLFGAGPQDLKLEFPVADQERRTLPNGTEFFGARILVSNTARESRDVPDILIVLRDERERQVYSWVVTPPQRTLTPGETLTINEAVTDVPKSAVFADIGWAPR